MLKNELTDSSSAVVTAETGLTPVLTAGGSVLHQRIAGIKRQHAALPMVANVLIARTMLFPSGKASITEKTSVLTTLGAVLHQRIALLLRRQRAKINALNAFSKLIISLLLMP
jgi:hypothetical protein